MQPFKIQRLAGWGRYPVEQCYLFEPEGRCEIQEILTSNVQSSYIARGLGRSYGDTALNCGGGVISQLSFNRILSFDHETGLLDCEAGVSFAEIIARFLPDGFFPSVTPGTKFVTLGGAIANNIHGKNHHRDGSIANFIDEITLLTPNGDKSICSPTTNRELFRATVGGIGLTGIILSAKLRLQRVESAYMLVDYHQATNIEEALDLFSSATDNQYQYSVAWVDCLTRGGKLGRGVLIRGNHARALDLSSQSIEPLIQRRVAQLGVPFDLPTWALNYSSVKIFNALFYRLHKEVAGQIVDIERFFYPLDRIRNWNRMYGSRGFVQYQIVLPTESSRQGLVALLERLAGSGKASFLAVLKRFGKEEGGLLSFPMEGFTLALDLPMTDKLPALLRTLDQEVLRYGGRIYLAKDALLSPEIFADMYPHLGEFTSLRERLDPQALLSSSMSRRLRITDRN